MAGESEAQALIRRIEASRTQLGGRLERVVATLDFPAQVKRRLSRHPALVFGGSAALGVGVSRLLRRIRRQPRSGWRSSLLKWLVPTIFAALKPWLKARLVHEVEHRLDRSSRRPTRSVEPTVSHRSP